MSSIIIGIVLIAAGALYAAYVFVKSKKAAIEPKCMQTSTIADALSLIDSMTGADPNYHHYVELQGTLQSEETVEAPYTLRQVAYFRNECSSVEEETVTEQDEDGYSRTRTVKTEKSLFGQTSAVPIFIQDQSCCTKVYIDMASFGDEVEFQLGCDRFEPLDSEWVQENGHSLGSRESGGKLTGYRLKEQVLNSGQPVYLLGVLYRSGARVCMGKTTVEGRPSRISCKSVELERSEKAPAKKTVVEKLVSLAVGGITTISGVFLIFTNIMG